MIAGTGECGGESAGFGRPDTGEGTSWCYRANGPKRLSLEVGERTGIPQSPSACMRISG
jgi:hypothetical protein